MVDQLWNLFRETGDPMGYLLYKAEQKKQQQEKKPDKAAHSPGEGTPPASV